MKAVLTDLSVHALRTAEEVAIACSVDHPHLTRVLATISDDNGATDSAVSALVMAVCQGRPMAEKPTSAHLLRCRQERNPCLAQTHHRLFAPAPCHGFSLLTLMDACFWVRWDPGETMSCGYAVKVALGVSRALEYLHSKSICHG